MRCFVAVDLSARVRAAIADVITALATDDGDDRGEGHGQRRGNVRWVVAQNLHVTLRFLGNIEPRDVASVSAVLGRLVAGVAPFAVRVAGLGMFPAARRARVIWVGLEGARLETLAAEVDAALGVLGLARDARPSARGTRPSARGTRPFTPHVTIGRVRSRRGWDEQLARIQAHASTEFGVSRVEEIVLYRSDLHPHGARYTAIDRLRLEGEQERAGR